jgi:thiol-disulfide isomerase/thioredoxin
MPSCKRTPASHFSYLASEVHSELSSAIKIVIMLLHAFFCLFTATFAQVQKQNPNDTIQIREVSGKQMRFILKNAHGKTLTLGESEKLYEKFNNQVVNRFKGGDPIIVELITPEDDAWSSFKTDVDSSAESKYAALQSRWLNKPFSNYNFTSLSGKKSSFSQLAGKVVVLNFWFTTCGPCIKEMPLLNQVLEQYKKDDSVVFLALALDDTKAVESFLQKNQFSYDHITSVKSPLLFGVTAYPTHIVIDRKGIVRFIQIGGDEIKNNLTRAIQNALTETTDFKFNGK